MEWNMIVVQKRAFLVVLVSGIISQSLASHREKRIRTPDVTHLTDNSPVVAKKSCLHSTKICSEATERIWKLINLFFPSFRCWTLPLRCLDECLGGNKWRKGQSVTDLLGNLSQRKAKAERTKKQAGRWKSHDKFLNEYGMSDKSIQKRRRKANTIHGKSEAFLLNDGNFRAANEQRERLMWCNKDEEREDEVEKPQWRTRKRSRNRFN